MSWTQLPELERYKAFETAALKETHNRPPDYSFPVTIWEVNNDILLPKFETSDVKELSNYLKPPKHPQTGPQVRVIFAPLDEVLRDLEPGITTICRALSIPPEFLSERLRGVCHSFGSRTDQNGFAAWFHYLCKAVELELRHRWYKSAFFLRKDPQGTVTLLCFGATPAVKNRLEQCILNGYWTDIQEEPLALFDLVLDGLFAGLDRTVWDLLDVIKKLERDVLIAQSSKGRKPVSTDQINFPELHNWAKHLIELNEVMESSLLVVDGTLYCIGKYHSISSQYKSLANNTTPFSTTTSRTATSTSTSTLVPGSTIPSPTTPKTISVQDQLRESLQYRRSLFTSTKLRLHSLEKRVSNTITLAFNAVTQQDSRMMRQDSASMTIISFMTLLFLPTAGVATIVGSQLFGTDIDDTSGTANVTYTSPLFWLMWWIAIPLTVVTMVIAVVYRRLISSSGSWSGSNSSDGGYYVYPQTGGGGSKDASQHVAGNMEGFWTGRRMPRHGQLPVQVAPGSGPGPGPGGQPATNGGVGIHMNAVLLNSQQSSGASSV